jgi:alkanesulfonate monooxygenase SsuD/methylene tetrahydromethanopterin reductase-like flavin-dependent oxidoreductase (luciferase family)
MKIGFKTSQTDVDWPTLLATWELGDQLEVFDSAWIFDHFLSLSVPNGPSHEALTALSALAARTRRLQVGHLVLSNTYRHPAVLAKAGATLDHISGGRFVLGLGAGWHEQEHAMYGLPMPPIGRRISELRSAVQVIRALWSSPDGVSLDAPPYRLTDAYCRPAPLTPNGPPIWLGTQGPRGLRIAAELADGWNNTGSLPAFNAKRDELLRACDVVGRDPSTLEISAQARLTGDDDAALGALRQWGTAYAEAGVDHLVLIMPAAFGPGGLQRLADEVAAPLRDRFG